MDKELFGSDGKMRGKGRTGKMCEGRLVMEVRDFDVSQLPFSWYRREIDSCAASYR